jgi:predicted TIM-barrel fold metal-dependent hydrolase
VTIPIVGRDPADRAARRVYRRSVRGEEERMRTIDRPRDVVGSEAALRFLLDQVGADRVVLGSDWPFVPWEPSPGGWVPGLASLTDEEKDRILWQNVEALLGLDRATR